MTIARPATYRKYTAECVAAGYDCLIENGFSVSAALRISKTIRLPDPEKIESRLTALREIGFSDPIRVITLHPGILGLTMTAIDSKLLALRTLGFRDPVKIVSTVPSILGCGLDRIMAAAMGVSRLPEERRDAAFVFLIRKRRAVIDRCAVERPTTRKALSMCARAKA